MKNSHVTPIMFVGGKGGVGKTTISTSLAIKLAKQKKKTLLISTDPAHNLGDIFDKKLNSEIINLDTYLDVLELNPTKITDEHFSGIEETLRGYAKPEMFGKIKEHLELSKHSPGAEEAAMLEAICKLMEKRDLYEHIIFDTAPTGHTMRLLSLPSIMNAWTDGLMSRQQNRENLKDAASEFWKKKKDDKFNPFKPTLQNRWDKAYERLNQRKELFAKTSEVLKDGLTCKVFLVMIPQILPLEETKRALNQLQSFKINCGGIFINQIIPKNQTEDFWIKQAKKQDQILDKIDNDFKDIDKFYINLSSNDLRGLEELGKLEFSLLS